MKKSLLILLTIIFVFTIPAFAQHQNANTRTGAQADTAIENALDAGSASGILKSDGANAITAATDGTDYLSSLVVDTTPQSGGDVDMNDNWLFDNADTLTDQDGTPAVTGGMYYITGNTGATSITDFVDADGDHSEFDALDTVGAFWIVVVVNDANTTFDFTSSNLAGMSADYAASSGESFMFIFNDTTDKWHMVGSASEVEDAAYDVTTWDGDLDAASKNALRDYLYTIDADGDGEIDTVEAATIAGWTWSGGDLSGSGLSPQVDESGVDHDSLANFVANEHLDWTSDQGATNILAANLPDLSATYEPAGITESDISDLGGTVYLKTAIDSTAEVGAIYGWSANVISLLGAADYAAIKTLLDTDDIQTLTGIAAGTAHLGAFSGSTITDSSTIKTALQELETEVEGLAGGHDAVTIAAGITGLTLSTQELSLHAYVEDAAEFTDPNADRIWFWDDSAGVFTGLTVGSGLDLTATTLTASLAGSVDISDDTNLAVDVNELTLTGDSLGLADHATARAALGLEIGADVQAYDADLTTYAGITPSANVQSLLGAADYAAMVTLMDTALDAVYEKELTNSAGLLAALSDESGTGVAIFGTAPTFTTSIAFNAVTDTVAGIENQNLVDKTAAEDISESWEWQDGDAVVFGAGADFSIAYDTDISDNDDDYGDTELTGDGLVFEGTDAAEDLEVVFNNTDGTYGVRLYVDKIYTNSITSTADSTEDSYISLATNSSYIGNSNEYHIYWEGSDLKISEGATPTEKIILNDTDNHTFSTAATTWDMGAIDSFEIPNDTDANQAANAFGELVGISDAWTLGTVATYDGSNEIYLIGALASDSPSDGQVAKWNTGGTITWENDNDSEGSPEYDDIADPGDNAAIDFTTYTNTWDMGQTTSSMFTVTATEDFGNVAVMRVSNTVGNPTDGTLLRLALVDTEDDVDHLEMKNGSEEVAQWRLVEAGTLTNTLTSDANSQWIFVTDETNGAADTNGIFEIQVDSGAATMDADQDIFNIVKGTTTLFSVDEDGDVDAAGNITASNLTFSETMAGTAGVSLGFSTNTELFNITADVSDYAAGVGILTIYDDSVGQDNASYLFRGAREANGDAEDHFLLFEDNSTGAAANGDDMFYVNSGGVVWAEGNISTGGAFLPDAADGGALGSATLEFSDIYLAASGVIYGENDQGNTLTSAATGWTMNLDLTVTQDLVTGANIELGHATANTLSASGGVLSIEGNVVHHTGGADIADADIADDITISNISQVQDISASASEINTPLDGASVTLTEFQELETIGATTISANQWATLGGIAETLGFAELDLLDGMSKSGSDTDLVTGTAGTNTYTAVWNADGDLVDGYDPTTKANVTSASLTTPIIADGSTLTFDESAGDPNDADIQLSAADGVFKIASVNGANNEDLTIDLDQTANTAIVTTSTGVTDLNISALNLVTTGTVSAGVPVIAPDADGHTITAAQAYGTLHQASGAATWTLPAIATGMSLCVYSTGANAVVVDANASDRIVLNGTALADGDSITSESTAGDFICLFADSASGWTTLGRSGTWTDTN